MSTRRAGAPKDIRDVGEIGDIRGANVKKTPKFLEFGGFLCILIN